jgi:hypothetical protein
MEFHHPGDWFGPGVGAPWAPRTWEGCIVFFSLFVAIGAIAYFVGDQGRP